MKLALVFAYAGVLSGLLCIMVRFLGLQLDLHIKKLETIILCVCQFILGSAVLYCESNIMTALLCMAVLGMESVIDYKKRVVLVFPLLIPAGAAMCSCFLQYQRLAQDLRVMELLLALSCLALMFFTAFPMKMQGRGDFYVFAVMFSYFLYANPYFVGSMCVCLLLLAYTALLVGLIISRIFGNKSWTLPFVPFLYVSFCVVVILI